MSNEILHEAAKTGNIQQLRSAIEAGANVNELDSHGESALHWCCYEGVHYSLILVDSAGHVECAALLLENGADIDLPDVEGRTPLHTSCAAGQRVCNSVFLSHVKESATFLMNRGAKLERRDKSGWTPRDHSILQGFQDIAQILMNELKVVVIAGKYYC